MRRGASLADIALLSEAIDSAEGWRGSLMPDDWYEFDRNIDAMRAALDRVRETREQLIESKKANQRLQRMVEKSLW